MKLSIFKDLFRGRTDAYGTGKGQCVKQPLTDSMLIDHLSGKGRRIGVYPLSPDIQEGTASWWIAIDFDDGCFSKAKKAYDTLVDLGIQAYIEVSKSKGYHLWIFCSEPILAADLRTIVSFAIQKAQITDYELFPKQDCLLSTPSGYGNYINLPLYGKDVKKGRTTFLDHTLSFMPILDERIFPFLQDVKRLSKAEIDAIIAKHGFLPSSKANVIHPKIPTQTKTQTV